MAVADPHESELRAAVLEHPSLREVVDEIDAADAQVDEIERRIVAGDEEVGLAELEKAERTGRLARLKARRAAAKAAADVEADRLARIDEQVERLHADIPDAHDEVLDKFAEALDAVRAFAGAVTAHNELVVSVIRELSELGELPDRYRYNTGDSGGSPMLRTGDLQVGRIDVAAFISEIAWRSLSDVGDHRVAAQFVRPAGISHDRHTAEAYGVPDEPNGAAGTVTASKRLAHLADRLRSELDR